MSSASAAIGLALVFDLGAQSANAPCFDFFGPARATQWIGLGAAVAGLTVTTVRLTAAGRRPLSRPDRAPLVLADVAALLILASALGRGGFDRCIPLQSLQFAFGCAGVLAWLVSALMWTPRHVRDLVQLVTAIGMGACVTAVALDLVAWTQSQSRLPRGSFWALVAAIGLIVVGGVGELLSTRNLRRAGAVCVATLASGLSLWLRAGADYTRPAPVTATVLAALAALVLAVVASPTASP